MLCQFTVKNFKSFKDEATLDLQATNISEHEDKIIVCEDDNERYLPLAAIYGPNGGGKSNMLEALYSLISKVMKPICAACENKNCSEILKQKNSIVPFKFNNSSINQPTEFELFFRTNRAEYKYYLAVKDEMILNESLLEISLDKKRKTEVFTREQKETRGININRTIFKDVTISDITETLPLLSYLGITHKKISVVKDVFDWFENGIAINNSGYSRTIISTSLYKSEDVKSLFLQMFKEMDMDIYDYQIKEVMEDKVEIFTKHMINNIESELDLSEESNGTIKLFGLLPDVLDSIVSGSTLVVDELDTKLHPKLIEYIIRLYRDIEKNKNGAQLIFTSHDLMTMNDDLLRRDEIWFVAKNNEQASQIYSLIEFKKENGKSPRKDEKYGKQYLEGRYGADPYLKRMINWGEIK